MKDEWWSKWLMMGFLFRRLIPFSHSLSFSSRFLPSMTLTILTTGPGEQRESPPRPPLAVQVVGHSSASVCQQVNLCCRSWHPAIGELFFRFLPVPCSLLWHTGLMSWASRYSAPGDECRRRRKQKEKERLSHEETTDRFTGSDCVYQRHSHTHTQNDTENEMMGRDIYTEGSWGAGGAWCDKCEIAGCCC